MARQVKREIKSWPDKHRQSFASPGPQEFKVEMVQD